MEQTKKCCTKCRVEKPMLEFHKDARAKSGTQSACKACVLKAKPKSKFVRKTAQEKLAKRQEYGQKYYRKNLDKAVAYARDYYRRVGARTPRNRAYRPSTPERNASFAKSRIARTFLKKATRLAETYADEIRAVYALAKETAELAGVEVHVDHIIPLRGVTEDGNRVSGLHVPWNLEPIYAGTNMRKGNRCRQSDALAW